MSKNGLNNIRIHPYFYLHEFDCRGVEKSHCCCNGAVILDSRFFDRLIMFRKMINQPMRILRGYSCPAWNKFVGGNENSKHLVGQAIDWDVYSSGYTEAEAANLISEAGLFTGVGVYGKSYRDSKTDDIVLTRGYKGLRGMVHLEFCFSESNGTDPGKTKLFRKWGDYNNA